MECEQPQLQQSPELLPSPGNSMSSSPRPRSRKPSLKLDLSSPPPLDFKAVPTNTLLFTGLEDADIFLPDNLQKIRDLVSQQATVHYFCPLKGFARILIVVDSTESAIRLRQIWDGEAILGNQCRVYFGLETDLKAKQGDNHLALPDAGRLFFISPPPSPPHGWESRTEDAPNTMVHAEDLADALAKLRHHNDPTGGVGQHSPVSPSDNNAAAPVRTKRSRSSTLIFQPSPASERGPNSPDLPCVTVDDMDEPADETEAMDISPVVSLSTCKPIMAHTARPPVELMEDATMQ
ncbi:Calcipressin-domain-containing protein [Podospora australis]|uniref:Calcipressin-domain-containing protein n=1 Tax=Podospora australis TaxID=1536484 RepID=A0AAN7ALL3_9PEZI|nr:Calcipressin-domain-containing protein [Podospora australis]